MRTRSAAVVAMVFLLAPAVVVFAAGVAANGFDATGMGVALGVVAASVVLVVLLRRASAFIECSDDAVVLGFAPLWRVRLRPAEIVEVTVVPVDAFAEFGGWGVKGRARDDRGLLFSAGGCWAVRVRTNRGWTYLVAFVDRIDADRALAAVSQVSCGDDRV